MAQVNRITKKDVERIAKLARLGLSGHDVDQAAKDLQGILDNFAQIQAINTNNVATSDDVTGLKNVTRTDAAEPEALCSVSDIVAGAPETQDSYIQVKGVFE